MKTQIKEIEYNVYCLCGIVWQPRFRSALWWRAKQRADKGFLDALCSLCDDCERQSKQPKGRIQIFGFDSFGYSFAYGFDSFANAVRTFRSIPKAYTTYITGVSASVKQRLEDAR